VRERLGERGQPAVAGTRGGAQAGGRRGVARACPGLGGTARTLEVSAAAREARW